MGHLCVLKWYLWVLRVEKGCCPLLDHVKRRVVDRIVVVFAVCEPWFATWCFKEPPQRAWKCTHSAPGGDSHAFPFPSFTSFNLNGVLELVSATEHAALHCADASYVRFSQCAMMMVQLRYGTHSTSRLSVHLALVMELHGVTQYHLIGTFICS